MSNYNPYSEALKALTSDRAIAFYSVRAQSHTQAVLDAALTVGIGIYQLCSFVYGLGAMVGEVHYSALEAQDETTHQTSPSPIQKALPAFEPIALLCPAKQDPDPRKALMLLSRDALRSACRDRHISYSGNETKAVLVEKLLKNGRHLGAISPYRIRHRSGRWVSIA